MAKTTRVAHFISPNKMERRPRRVVFFDTETESALLTNGERQQVLRLGWACYWSTNTENDQAAREWCFFTTIEQFWSFVSEKLQDEEDLYLLAHNIAFDFRIVGGFEHAKREWWKLDFIFHRQMTTLITYKTDSADLKLLDMCNFYPVALSEVGRVVGIEKTEVDFETCSFQELSDYCRNDVEILVKAWESWLSFLNEHELGDFKSTLAAQAMSAYRHNFLDYSIKIHGDASVCEIERAAYRGGRVECFEIGDLSGEQFYQLDVNGMYCYMMQLHEYPRLLRAWPATLDRKQLVSTLKRHCVIAHVVIQTEYPVFPVKLDTYNVYPTGIFQTTLTTPELQFALSHCDILKIGQAAIYECALIFRTYARYFSGLKERYWREGNQPFREISKRFANSLYGKFGQSDIETDLSFDLPPVGPRESPYFDWRVKKWYRIYELGEQVIFEKSGGESFNSFPAIPAHVTAYARMYLWSLIEKAGLENVFYCATDSLIVNQAGYDNLSDMIDDYELGKLKVEKVAHELEIWGPNNFRLGDKLKHGGIRKNAVRLSHDVFEQDKFLGLRGAIRRNEPDLVTIKTVQKRMKREVRTGVVGQDGRVTPFQFPQ